MLSKTFPHQIQTTGERGIAKGPFATAHGNRSCERLLWIRQLDLGFGKGRRDRTDGLT
jgi:hypothetical protein